MGRTGCLRLAALAATLGVAVASPPARAADSPFAARATVTSETERCASLGRKQPGLPAGQAMADHVLERFRAAGLDTSVEEFHLPMFKVRSERIEVTAPTARAFPGEAFFNSGTGTVEAPVVYVGTGRAIDYAGKDVKDKVVMVDRNEAFHRSAQLTEIVAQGGAAMLYVSGSPRNLVQTGTVRFAQELPAPILTMTVGAQDGAALKGMLDEGLRMRLSVDAVREDEIGRNVIGVRPGTRYPDRYIVVGGHHDSWHAGAIDNCSAMGSLLQIVEQTREVRPAYTVVFAAWDAEEVGLTGSYDWVIRHQDLVRRTVLNENLEMTSAASYIGDVRLPASVLNVMFGTLSPTMNALVYEAAIRNGHLPAPLTASGVRAVSGGIIPTDLQPFYTQGVQGFSTFSSTPYYHTVEDEPDKIDPPAHERVTNFLRDVLIDVQAVPPEALAGREVPTVTVTPPAEARAGEPVPIDVEVVDAGGRPLEGSVVSVLIDQRGHWAVARGLATELGGGRYRYEIPAGATGPGKTTITASVSAQTYAAQGYAAMELSPVARLRPRSLSLQAERARGLPPLVRLRGRLALPRGVSPPAACHGSVHVTLRRRGRLIGAAVSPLRMEGARCVYARTVRLSNAYAAGPRSQGLTARARFRGNDLLLPLSSRPVAVPAR